MSKTKTTMKALKKWAKKHGYKYKKVKIAQMSPADMMGFLVPPHLPGDVPGVGPFAMPRDLSAILEGLRGNAEWMRSGPIEVKPTEEDREAYDGGAGLNTEQLLHYAGVHSQRMEDEGYTKTALVISWLAGKIEDQRPTLRGSTMSASNSTRRLLSRVT